MPVNGNHTKRSAPMVMGRLALLVRPLAGYMALAILAGLAGHLCAAFLTVLGASAVLAAGGYALPLSAGTALVLLAVFAVLRGPLRYGEQACNHFIAFKLLALIRDKVFRALRRLCPAKLEGRDRGDLISLITSDIELLEVFYAHTISPVLIAVLFSGVMTVFIGSFHPLLGLLALAAYLTVGLAAPLLIARWGGQDARLAREQSAAMSGYVLESLRGLPEILQYGAGEARLAGLEHRARELADQEDRMKAQAARAQAAAGAVMLAFDIGMLALASALYARGAVDLPGVLLPTLALMGSFGPTAALAGLGSTLQTTLAAADRVLDILDEEPAAPELTGLPDPGPFTGAKAEQVGFAYGEQPVLADVSLDIPEGSVVGICGPSGSGKSTLLRLFMRFWQVQKGRVEVAGAPVDGIDTARLRQMEALVTQDTHLFRDSIAANLRIAKPDATQEELEAACKMASVHDFIQSLPQGYDTPVGELGDTLSGGERQRLGLARAFLHDAPFLLLDEPTSNLDSLNEAVILRALRRERAGRTVLVVSHRPSTLRVADRVLTMEGGRLA